MQFMPMGILYDENPLFKESETGLVLFFGFTDKLRLSVGRWSFGNGFAGEDNYVYIGILYVQGFIYW